MTPSCLLSHSRAHSSLLRACYVSLSNPSQVDVVGQIGRPKTITGFQTHTTPVLLSTKDRAELVSDEYESLSNVLEGFVILRKKVATAAGTSTGAGASVGTGAGAAAGSS
jgi:hypothetical protein